LRFAVDEEVARLPSKYRAAIVSCYLEGLTHEEAAARLRCPVGTIRSRLARGRVLLKDRLERSGLGLDARRCDPLAMLALEQAQSVVGSQLITTTAQAAARLAAGQALAAIVPARLAQLVAGATLTMRILKFSMAASLAFFAGLAAWGAVVLAARAPGADAPAVPSPAAATVLAETPTAAPAESSEEEQADQPKKVSELAIPGDLPPVVINIEPTVGASDVDPGLREIRVTFSKKMMDKTWSWTEGKKYAVPKLDGTIHYERDQRTCVMPVKLEPGKTYVLGINSERFRNFKDADGRPALPYLVVFHTKAAR
jgi:Sigma-70, region 4/Bacterial Ig-like domain